MSGGRQNGGSRAFAIQGSPVAKRNWEVENWSWSHHNSQFVVQSNVIVSSLSRWRGQRKFVADIQSAELE